MAELANETASECCAPEQQADCCAESEQDACCAPDASTCGCAAGSGEETHRVHEHAGAAIIRATKQA